MRQFTCTLGILTTILMLAASCSSPGSAQTTSNSAQAPAPGAEMHRSSEGPKELAELGEAAFKQQDWSTAAGAFERLAELDPTHTQNWMRLGYCRLMQRELRKSIEAFQRVTAGPALPTARYNIACALALQGEKASALDALDRAVEAGFSNAATLATDTDLASLHEDPRFTAVLAKLQASVPPKFEPPAEARQFDFWIGDWNVVSATGAKAGASRIEKILNGCAIQENWTSAGGNNGKSFNLYDPKKGEWRQHWIDDSGLETFYVGGFAGKCMSLTSEQRSADGKKQLHRMRFFDLGEEGVRQWGEVTEDDGANWKTEFDLYYRHA
jgi:hypothetical protein